MAEFSIDYAFYSSDCCPEARVVVWLELNGRDSFIQRAGKLRELKKVAMEFPQAQEGRADVEGQGRCFLSTRWSLILFGNPVPVPRGNGWMKQSRPLRYRDCLLGDFMPPVGIVAKHAALIISV